MQIFASHFGFFEVGPGPTLKPFRHDPAPSPVGLTHLDLARDPARVRVPMARKGWLAGDGGAARGDDTYVELSLEEATALAARELDRVRTAHGNRAIFGGSYGWGSAGRFHHPQSQLKRFLNLAGGFTFAVNTYSYGTAKVILPHVVGAEHAEVGALAPSWDQIVEHCRLIVAFGGMRLANAQVEAGSTGAHRVGDWLERFRAAGGEIVTLSPDARDAVQGRHIPIRPGSDTAAMLAMCHTLLEEGLADAAFLGSFTTGAEEFARHLLGQDDGTPKSADWAAALCGVPAEDLRALARRLAAEPSLLNLAWSLQRARFGEQPYWASVALAAMAGVMGRPGLGLALGLSAVSSVGQPVRGLRGPSFPMGTNPVSDYIPVARITDLLERPGGTLPYDGKMLDLPDIRLVWWAGGNPYHHHQDLFRLERAWTRPDTVIVHENVWTATARHADLVFPSAMPFERSDIAGSSRDRWLAYSPAVMPPPPGVPTDHEVFARIAAHLGLENAFRDGRDEAAWLEHLYDRYRMAHPELPDWDRFRQDGYACLDADQAAPRPMVPFAQLRAGHPLSTPSGRIELVSDRIAGFALSDCPSHPTWLDPDGEEEPLPFHLLSPQPETRLHSQLDPGPLARDARAQGFEVLRAHPDDLSPLELDTGDIAEVFNARGVTLVSVAPDPGVRRGTLVLPTGGWFDPVTDALGRRVDLGGNPNVLTSDAGSSALSQGASANHPRVGLRPLADPTLIEIRKARL
ncbi:molybdopterin-dependent oxidoreductase [Falsirhodobacter sp. 20TX0035]|uniref:molybdopterin-dependent oxidoreductase n=1 Tax=Falsirhodobacter sp. 20TX0035 TaxID=3022019 RepID=UPI00232B8966|nr:molybdopterin-dependent oxidoreductase [Falsirhodobacter sp. 20TX0035]MDB6453027.1 molybdopterin-dependent oxidoreductase [Falsirhodobacter sp. 20TX0035]